MITKVCHFEEHSINNDLLINEDMRICKYNWKNICLLPKNNL